MKERRRVLEFPAGRYNKEEVKEERFRCGRSFFGTRKRRILRGDFLFAERSERGGEESRERKKERTAARGLGGRLRPSKNEKRRRKKLHVVRETDHGGRGRFSVHH